MQIELAVVIPAYKPDFLENALESLCSQTDQRFRLYVGDDGSPVDLEFLVKKYRDRIDLMYHRFPDNVGSISIVKHWKRCIDLTSEPWVWLFSDDDLADQDCTKKFFETLDSTHAKYDVYRFNSLSINERGDVLFVHPPHPDFETSLEFTYHTLCAQRVSTAPEYLFRRNTFDECGGFVDFPLAWCSDHASVDLFSRKSGIKTIGGPMFRWRRSAAQISSMHDSVSSQRKLRAVMDYCAWLYKGQLLDSFPFRATAVSKECFREAVQKFALRHWRSYIPWCPTPTMGETLRAFALSTGIQDSLLKSVAREALFAQSLPQYPYFATLIRRICVEMPRTAKRLEDLLRLSKSVYNKLSFQSSGNSGGDPS